MVKLVRGKGQQNPIKTIRKEKLCDTEKQYSVQILYIFFEIFLPVKAASLSCLRAGLQQNALSSDTIDSVLSMVSEKSFCKKC